MEDKKHLNRGLLILAGALAIIIAASGAFQVYMSRMAFLGILENRQDIGEPTSDKIWVLPDYNSISEVATFEVTAYDAFSAQSINVKKWRDGKTALNRPAIPEYTIAVDPRIIPFDSYVFIPGLGWRVAEDVGGAIKGYRIDVLMLTKKKAMEFGRKKMFVLWVPPENMPLKRNGKVGERKK